MRWLVGRSVILAIVSACAAAPPAIPPLPSQGGPAWIELSSQHFTVWTDGSAEQGRRLIRDMEYLRQVVYGVAFGATVSASKSLVIAFRNIEEVHAFIPKQFTAYTWSPRNPLRQPVIVITADAPESDPRILTHELTHVISYNVLPEQPKWFSEGLAGYFETVRLDTHEATIDVGRPLDFMMQRLRTLGLTPTSSLFACAQPGCMDDRYYATAWLLFSYLANERPQQLVRYMERISVLAPDAQPAVWPEVFPDLAPVKLDHELARFAAYGKQLVRKYDVKLRDWPITQRTLGDADVQAARGLIRHLLDWKGPLPAEIDAAIAAAPTHVVAHVVRTAHANKIDPDAARAIAAAHPDDWRAWWLVGFALQQGPEASEARDKLCALVAKNPAVLPPGLCPPQTPPAPPAP